MANIKTRDKLREKNTDDTICFDSNDTLKFPDEWITIMHTTVDKQECKKRSTKWANTAKKLLKTPLTFVCDDMERRKSIPELKNEAGIYEWRLKFKYMGNDLVEPLVFYVGKGDVRDRIQTERRHGHGSLGDLFTSAYVGCDDIANIVSEPSELVLKYEVRVFYTHVGLGLTGEHVATNNEQAASSPVLGLSEKQECAERLENAQELARIAEDCIVKARECRANFKKVSDTKNVRGAHSPEYYIDKAIELTKTANDCTNKAYKLVAEADDFVNRIVKATVNKRPGRWFYAYIFKRTS